MSRPARVALVIIAVGTVALEIVALLAYRNTVDGQAVLVNVAILVYALILVGAVTVIDRFLQRHHHRPRNR